MESPEHGLTNSVTFPSIAPGAQYPGFFTSVSSSGTQAGSAIVWAVSRPQNNNPEQ
ncbi:MAG: hypothetical protein ACLPYS_01945 [Vulcanimicrobiaceae bacterium]